ncbi:MAG: cytochrome c [Pseudolabrys sp.]|nr:cytochrome c [Pseudolabrys sp.]
MAQAGRTSRSSLAARSGAARLHPSGGLIRSLAIMAVSVATIVIPGAAKAQGGPDAATLKHGEELVTKNCGSCHAVGRTGTSPRPDAPAFRVLGQRYPIDSLEESLGEGLMSGHPDMPEFSFESDDVGAIIDYLKSIQAKR